MKTERIAYAVFNEQGEILCKNYYRHEFVNVDTASLSSMRLYEKRGMADTNGTDYGQRLQRIKNATQAGNKIVKVRITIEEVEE